MSRQYYLVAVAEPSLDMLKDSTDRTSMLAIAYNLVLAVKAHVSMPVFFYAWPCNHKLARWRIYHYPHSFYTV